MSIVCSDIRTACQRSDSLCMRIIAGASRKYCVFAPRAPRVSRAPAGRKNCRRMSRVRNFPEGILTDFGGSARCLLLAGCELRAHESRQEEFHMAPALSSQLSQSAGRLRRDDCDINELAALAEPADYPFADSVTGGVLLYQADDLIEQSTKPEVRAEIQDEIARASHLAWYHGVPGSVRRRRDRPSDIRLPRHPRGPACGRCDIR